MRLSPHFSRCQKLDNLVSNLVTLVTSKKRKKKPDIAICVGVMRIACLFEGVRKR